MSSGWHREDIKAEVRKRGSSLFDLARRAGLTPRTMTRSLRVRYPSYHAVISRFIGVPTQELWPHWYQADGSPRGRTRPDARTPRLKRFAEAE